MPRPTITIYTQYGVARSQYELDCKRADYGQKPPDNLPVEYSMTSFNIVQWGNLKRVVWKQDIHQRWHREESRA